MKATVYIVGLLVFCAGLMISCDSTGEEEQYVILAGRVTESDTANYVNGAIVADGNNPAMVDTTDERGYFELRGIEKAKHTVRFSKDGYETTELELEYTGELMRPIMSKHILMNPLPKE